MTTLDQSVYDVEEGVGEPEPVPVSEAPEAAEVTSSGPSGPSGPVVEESPARVAPSRWVREAVFREKLRGYHPADVDAFLDQVSFAFDELEARLRDAEERIAKARGETAVVVADDETVRRTLTLAQRTAELAIQEAERQAAELVAAAKAETEAMVREAEERAAAIRERERSKLVAELTHLESARAVAAEDLDELELRRRAEHARLSEVLSQLAELVEQRLA